MNKAKMIIQWVLTALFAIAALLWLPSLSSIFLLLGAIILLPIKPLEHLWEKYKLKLLIRIVIAVFLLVIGFAVTPDDDPPAAEKDRTQTDPSSSDKNDDKNDDDGKDTKNDPDEADNTPADITANGQDIPDADSDNGQNKPDADSDDGQNKPDADSGNDQNKPETDSDDSQLSRHPVFTVEEFGNFKEINTTVFEISNFPPEELVGRWYEDGWLEGYYLELYGNGTWRYYGEDERNGYYRITHSLFVLEESEFGVDVCQPMIFYDEDEKAYMMSVMPTGPEAFKTRTDPEDYVCFWREDYCRHCNDLDAYYVNKYPYKELAGDWYPVGDRSGKYYYSISAAAHWSYILGHGIQEVGVLEEAGDRSFTSEGATWGKLKTFKLADDGYLYIDEEAYEKVDRGSLPPIRSLGTFCYESGEGYTFYEDWTFESVPGSSFDEHGTYLFIGDNLLLYDDNGYRLHALYQDEYMDWDGVSIEEAWMKRMENRDDSDLYGEALYFVIPSED